MPIVTRCPKCPAAYKVPDDAVGRQAKCKKCGHLFIVAKAADAPTTPVPPNTTTATNGPSGTSIAATRPLQTVACTENSCRGVSIEQHLDILKRRLASFELQYPYDVLFGLVAVVSLIIIAFSHSLNLVLLFIFVSSLLLTIIIRMFIARKKSTLANTYISDLMDCCFYPDDRIAQLLLYDSLARLAFENTIGKYAFKIWKQYLIRAMRKCTTDAYVQQFEDILSGLDPFWIHGRPPDSCYRHNRDNLSAFYGRVEEFIHSSKCSRAELIIPLLVLRLAFDLPHDHSFFLHATHESTGEGIMRKIADSDQERYARQARSFLDMLHPPPLTTREEYARVSYECCKGKMCTLLMIIKPFKNEYWVTARCGDPDCRGVDISYDLGNVFRGRIHAFAKAYTGRRRSYTNLGDESSEWDETVDRPITVTRGIWK